MYLTPAWQERGSCDNEKLSDSSQQGVTEDYTNMHTQIHISYDLYVLAAAFPA